MGSLPATTEANRFGKYSLVARLATGGMAEIFLARLQGAAGFEKLVCIKRILPHLARDKQFVAMFLDEARIAARISHPNVCQVFELGEIEGSYYLAMEYLEGVPLACFRRSDYYGEMPEPRLVAGIAVQACEGLHHAHQLKNTDGSVMEVVHRDVSPQNLFVTVDGIVKVLDFGIAKIQDATVRTSTGAVKGTYAYMAPEQLRGERVDRRTDVFALGIVMWETLMRRHLFQRDTDFLTFQAITTDPIEDVCALRPDVPPALSAVIMTALARDREQRYPTARVLGEAIAAAIQPLSGSAISEEIARAFPAELGEQAALIRVAREGGAFALDLDRGPSVGHGTELLTTPTSNLRTSSETPVSRSNAGAPVPPASGVGAGAGVGVGAGGAPVARVATTPSARMVAAAMPVVQRSWRPLAIAVVALAVGGGGAYLYARVSREPAPRGPGAGSTVVAVAAPPDVALPAVAIDAATPAAAVPPIDAPPGDAAPGAAAGAAPHDKHVAMPAVPSAARPGGPPGFITIDSAPVYAVIYIDGKNYGETPLVKLSLPPGRHSVHAVAPSGASRDVRITIESGKTASANRIEW
jgi:eukaryotic-like serine/threonine-protein kinase